MGKFIQNCDRLGEETGAGRIVIHHESDKSARGGKGGPVAIPASTPQPMQSSWSRNTRLAVTPSPSSE